MKYSFAVYLLIMALTTYLIRLLPLIFVKGKIQNRFVLSMLHYIPYAVLSAMMIPAVFYVSEHIVSSLAGLAVAFILAYRGKSLTVVAFTAVVAVFIGELICL